MEFLANAVGGPDVISGEGVDGQKLLWKDDPFACAPQSIFLSLSYFSVSATNFEVTGKVPEVGPVGLVGHFGRRDSDSLISPGNALAHFISVFSNQGPTASQPAARIPFAIPGAEVVGDWDWGPSCRGFPKVGKGAGAGFRASE